jgi:hypothetical protein
VTLPTNRLNGDIIQATDINDVAQAVNDAQADVDALAVASMTSATVQGAEIVTQAQMDAMETANTDVAGVLYVIVAPGFLVQDEFARNVTDGLGTATTGGTWTTIGTAADFDVINDGVDGYAQTNLPTAGADRYATIALSGTSQLLEATFSLTTLPTASSFFWFAVLRFTSTSQYYRVRCEITATTVKLIPQKVHTNPTPGTVTDMGSASASLLTYTSGTKLSMKAEVIDLGTSAQIRAKLWAASGSEPGTWTVDQTDTGVGGSSGIAVLPAGGAGFYMRSGGTPAAAPLPNTFRTHRITVT